MSTVEEKKLHSLELESSKGDKLRLATPSSALAFAGLLLFCSIVVYFAWLRTGNQPASVTRDNTAVTSGVSQAYLPSAVHTAKLMSKAVDEYRGAMRMVYTAALGGSYVPVIPYELMLDEFMLKMVADFNLLNTVPNVVSIPKDEDPPSMGYGICEGIRNGNTVIEQVTAQYSTKLPEVLFGDADQLRGTALHKYFIRYAAGTDCEVFLGELRNARERRSDGKVRGFGHAIPHPAAKFKKEDFGAYIRAVQKMENDIKAIIETTSATK